MFSKIDSCFFCLLRPLASCLPAEVLRECSLGLCLCFCHQTGDVCRGVLRESVGRSPGTCKNQTFGSPKFDSCRPPSKHVSGSGISFLKLESLILSSLLGSRWSNRHGVPPALMHTAMSLAFRIVGGTSSNTQRLPVSCVGVSFCRVSACRCALSEKTSG